MSGPQFILRETPELQWFDPREFKCRMCGKRADGELMGRRNETYGLHCRRCAERRLKVAEQVREELASRGEQ